MYLENCAVISLFIISVFLVNSVNSFSCYTCSSTENSECLTNPVQDKFITECNPSGIRARTGRKGMNVSINNDEITINGVPISIGTTVTDDGKTIISYDGSVAHFTNVGDSATKFNYTVTSSGNIKQHNCKDPASIKWACAKFVGFNWNWRPRTVVVRACVPKYSSCRCNRAVRCFRCKAELCNSAESPTLTLEMFALLGVVGVYSTM